MTGSPPLPASAGSADLILVYGLIGANHVGWSSDSLKFRVDFACWKDSFQRQGADDITFVVEVRPVYANKGYITYISPVMQAMLTGGFKEAQSDNTPITQTSAEDLRTLRSCGTHLGQLTPVTMRSSDAFPC